MNRMPSNDRPTPSSSENVNATRTLPRSSSASFLPNALEIETFAPTDMPLKNMTTMLEITPPTVTAASALFPAKFPTTTASTLL